MTMLVPSFGTRVHLPGNPGTQDVPRHVGEFRELPSRCSRSRESWAFWDEGFPGEEEGTV